MGRKLTKAYVTQVEKPGKYLDQDGLILRVKPSRKRGVTKSWIQRLTEVMPDGRPKQVDRGLGPWPLISLTEARGLAFENRRRAYDRRLETKRAAILAPAVPTFSEAAKQVKALKVQTLKGGASSKAARQWLDAMERYAFPVLGRLPVDRVSARHVIDVLQPLWTVKHSTGQLLLQRIGAILDWSVSLEYRKDRPTSAAILAGLPRLNGTAHKTHHKALPYDQVGKALKTIRATRAAKASKLALEFLILTATRTSETRLAQWSEIKFDSATWIIPAERMKGSRPHRVPLSDRAIAILREARQGNNAEFVFVGYQGKPLSESTLNRLCAQHIDGSPHGFRSTFRDWIAEQTDASREVAESCLAHVRGNGETATQRAYFRSDLLERRRTLMQDWADFLA